MIYLITKWINKGETKKSLKSLVSLKVEGLD